MAHPGGRPSKYTPELANEICDTIATNGMGLARLCKANPHWPTAENIRIWCKKHPEFQLQYTNAKKEQIETLVDEILDIADDNSRDRTENDEGKLVTDHEHLNRSRLRIDTRKWLAAKLAPKIYGDKTSIEGTLGIKQEDALKELE